MKEYDIPAMKKPQETHILKSPLFMILYTMVLNAKTTQEDETG